MTERPERRGGSYFSHVDQKKKKFVAQSDLPGGQLFINQAGWLAGACPDDACVNLAYCHRAQAVCRPCSLTVSDPSPSHLPRPPPPSLTPPPAGLNGQ